MMSRTLRRNVVRLAAVVVAAACLDGCAAAQSEAERSFGQEVVVKAGSSQSTTNPKTTVTNTYDGVTEIEVTVYAVRCAGASGTVGRACIKANKAANEAWKANKTPFIDPSTGREYKNREDWAENIAFFNTYTYRLGKGEVFNLADLIKEHALDDPDNGAFFFYAVIKVKRGTCDVVKPKTTTLASPCGDGEVLVTEPPATTDSTSTDSATSGSDPLDPTEPNVDFANPEGF